VKGLWKFTKTVLKAFKANQGLLLAGAVAYYALLSIVPLLILFVIALSHFIDPAQLLSTIARYLEWVVPGQGDAIVRELSTFLEHREIAGWVLMVTMIFFSSLAFTVLENAMSVIFLHRVAIRRRHFMVSAILPYLYIVLLGVGLMIVTVMAGAFGRIHNDEVSRGLLYLMGVFGEVLLITSIYLVMPVGRLSFRVALMGGVVATVLWEITRHILRWYFDTLSQVSTVYGSFTTAIVILLSLEFAAILLLLGAQVIAEYERRDKGKPAKEPQPLRTDR
jgi:membrane protein